MSVVSRFNDRLLREKKIVVSAKHLSFGPLFIGGHVNAVRTGSAGGIAISMPMGYAIAHDMPASVKFPLLGAAALVGHQLMARAVQKAQRQMRFSHPIIFPEFESQYPEGWMNASRIKETHPIFYFDLKGNMVFVKSSRAEYFRYLYQKSILGKLGYNTWWWRGYIEPPKAPESVKKWARERMRRAMESLREARGRSGALRPAYSPLRSRRAMPRPRRR